MNDSQQAIIEWLHERTEHLDIFLFFCQSLNDVLLLMFRLLVEKGSVRFYCFKILLVKY